MSGGALYKLRQTQLIDWVNQSFSVLDYNYGARFGSVQRLSCIVLAKFSVAVPFIPCT